MSPRFFVSAVSLSILLSASCPRSFAIVGGVEMDRERPELPFVYELYAGPDRATATHVGGGIFLTAAHNITASAHYPKHPKLLLVSADERIKLVLEANEYTVLFAPKHSMEAQTLSSGQRVQVPTPDIALIIPKDPAARRQVGMKPAVPLQGFRQAANARFIVAGCGTDNYRGTQTQGCKWGEVELDPNRPVREDIASRWIDLPEYADGRASPAPGDSGGPLLRVIGGNIVQVGITRKIELRKGDGNRLICLASYLNLAQPGLLPWIRGVLANPPR